MKPISSLPARLRWARETAKLSKRRLSDLAGLDPSHVRFLESGEREDPHASTLGAIAPVLGTTVDWLAFGRGSAPDERQIHAAVATARNGAPPVADASSPASDFVAQHVAADDEPRADCDSPRSKVG
jgi:transcriptional regulator with XRE-family HTH domain